MEGTTPETPTPETPVRNDRNMQIGLILVILGGLALLSNLGFFRGVQNVVGALLFAFLGGLALRHYRRHHKSVALVGAFALFGLAAATITGAVSGFFFLGLIGAGFLALYLADRQRWWAIIPAGTLFSLAVVAGLGEVAPRYESSSVLFIGLAATFLVLYRLPEDPKRWAIYPAVVSLALAVLGLSFGGSWVLPLVLVGVGVYLLYRRSEHGPAVQVPGPDTTGPAGNGADPAGGGGGLPTAAGDGAAAAQAAGHGPELQAQDGVGREGSEQDGLEQDGLERDGLEQDGPEQDGPERARGDDEEPRA